MNIQSILKTRRVVIMVGLVFFLRISSTVGLFEVEILYYTECQLSASVFIVTVSILANMSEYINRNS